MSRDFEAAFASTEEVRNQLLLRSVCLLSSVAAFLLDKSFAESSYLSPRSSRAVVGRQVWKEAESTTLRSEFSLSISYFSVQSLKFISNDYEITTSTSRDLHNSPRRLYCRLLDFQITRYVSPNNLSQFALGTLGDSGG